MKLLKTKYFFKSVEKQDGNVLFLILIAVALFAALSYAVTSSTTNSSKSSDETILINSTQVIQFPTSVGFGIARMVSAGISIDEIRFNHPDEFDELDSTEIGVFHPDGGGVSYSRAPSDLMVDKVPGDWFFNANLEVPYVGVTGEDGNDIIAFLPNLKQSICRKINEEHGLGDDIPLLTSDLSSEYVERMYDDGSADYEIPIEDVPDIDDGNGVFEGRPFGCFENGDGTYVYFHVVVER